MRFWAVMVTAEGRAAFRAAYHEMASKRRDGGMDKNALQLRLTRCGAPALAISQLRKPLQRSECRNAADLFLTTPREIAPFLPLIGPTGIGKTLAAAEVFLRASRDVSWELPTGAPEPLVWVQAPELTRISAFSSDDEARLRAMRQAILLVIDEMGDEGTQLGVAALRDVLMARDATNRRTVITSNVRPQAFRQRYGDPLWDRLMKRGIMVDLQKAKSMRERRAS